MAENLLKANSKSRKNSSSDRVYSTNTFIISAKTIHNDKYSYNKTEYITSHQKVCIICPTHGEFFQKPNSHLNGQGCPKCSNNQKLTINDFIIRANTIHNNKYDYSMAVYVNRISKICIICPTHGEFYQRAGDHLNGRGCIKCGLQSSKDSQTLTLNDFIIKSKEIHGDKYDYNNVEYINNKNNVVIICPEHGRFSQQAGNHLAGMGCRECAISDMKSDLNNFIEKAKQIHNNKYNYDDVDYFNSYTKIFITCPAHGKFLQRPNAHLGGQGCPKCPSIISSGHKQLIDFIESIYDDDICINYRCADVGEYEIDVWLPKLRIGFEYHGGYFHSANNMNDDNRLRYYHRNKSNQATINNFRLYQLYSFENFEIWKSIITNALKKSIRTHARKCELVKLSCSDNIEFFQANHLQSAIPSSITYGLISNGSIMCCMSFIRRNESEFEIGRFANKLNHSVVGGASKIVSHFMADYNPSLIYTFADRRYSIGNLYKNMNFKFIKLTRPNYKYINSNCSIILSRQQCQKHKLYGLLNDFNPRLTEAENMFNNGYRRLWDAGNIKFVWNKD